MKRISLLLLIVLVLLISCSRFDHDFAEKEVVDFEAVLFNPLQQSLDSLQATNLQPLMAYFADDYLYYGIDKEARQEYFQNLFSVSSQLSFVVSMQDAEELSESTAIASWNLKVYADENKTLLADSTFVNDRLFKQGSMWIFGGNGISGEPSAKQRVIIEYFTFVGCPNCPIVESRIRALQAQYPTQLSYVEYHTAGELSFGMAHNDLLAYYSAFPSPVSIIQGANRLSGSASDVLEDYDELIALLSEVEAPLKLEDFSYSIEGQNVSASVKINPLNGTIPQEQLRLKYVLMKKTWNFADPEAEAHHNVALAKGSLDISTHNLSNPISFDLSSPIAIPDDAYMLIFVQKVPTPFANNATIFNGIEVPIAPAKR